MNALAQFFVLVNTCSYSVCFVTLLFGLSGVCNKEIKSSTVLQQQSTAAALCLCLLEVQSY